MFDWSVWLGLGLALAGQVATCRAFWQMGRQQEKRARLQTVSTDKLRPATGNPADDLLQSMPEQDACAVVICKVMDKQKRSDGMTSEELLMLPCWATRSHKPEPCLTEVSRALRFLADRIDNALAETGFEAAKCERKDLGKPVLN